MPTDFELNVNQQTQVEFVKQEQPILNIPTIKKELDKIKLALHFIDYETYASAITRLDGLSPHKYLTFQVSIYTLTEANKLTHFEYLLEAMKIPIDILQATHDFTGLNILNNSLCLINRCKHCARLIDANKTQKAAKTFMLD